MANGRKPVDLGFAEFAAQVVAELHEGPGRSERTGISPRKTGRIVLASTRGVCATLHHQRTIEAELVRLFLHRRGKAHRIRAGASYVAKTAKHAESPPIQSKLGIQLTPQDLRVRGGRTQLSQKE